MKHILITGALGFIGSRLLDSYSNNKNVQLYAIDKKKSNLSNVKKLDLLNKKKLFDYFRNKKIDYIFHLGGTSDIDFSVNNPDFTLKNNVMSLLNLLSLSKEKKIKKFIFSSSIYTKGNKGSFYRISKKTCEDILIEYNRLYSLEFSILRYGSIFGNGSPKQNSVHRLAYQIKNGNTITREGTGNEVRRYININDAIKLTKQSLQKQYTNCYIDITGSKKNKISDMINLIRKSYPSKKFIYDGINNYHHYDLTPEGVDKIKIYEFKPVHQTPVIDDILKYIKKF
jgi:UDP-glucose 4-epimerase